MAFGGLNSRSIYAVRPRPADGSKWLRAAQLHPSYATNPFLLLFLRVNLWASIACRENVRNRLILNDRGRGEGEGI